SRGSCWPASELGQRGSCTPASVPVRPRGRSSATLAAVSDAGSEAAAPVAGIDAFQRGWVAVRLARAEMRVAHGRRFAELIRRIEPLEVVAVDMPIGLPGSVRNCDRLARAFVKPRQNSVFFAPPAAVFAESSYHAANTRARELLGRGISQQA